MIDHITMAGGHLADKKLAHAGDRFELLLRAGNKIVGGVGDIVLGPNSVMNLTLAQASPRFTASADRQIQSLQP
ncbi:MAG: hypothetical protein ACJASX_004245 [Limisphaerales bacterium]